MNIKFLAAVLIFAILGFLFLKLADTDSPELNSDNVAMAPQSIEAISSDPKRESEATERKGEVTLTLMSAEEVNHAVKIAAFKKQIEENLQTGSYTILDDGYVSYSAGSRLKVPNGPTLANETGVMFSDIELKSFAGDLLIGSHGIPHIHRGILEIKEGGKGFTLITLEEDLENELGQKASNKSAGQIAGSSTSHD